MAAARINGRQSRGNAQPAERTLRRQPDCAPETEPARDRGGDRACPPTPNGVNRRSGVSTTARQSNAPIHPIAVVDLSDERRGPDGERNHRHCNGRPGLSPTQASLGSRQSQASVAATENRKK